MIEISLSPSTLVAGQDCDLEVRLTNSGTGTCTSVVFKLLLPNDFLVLRGGDRVELERLAAGETQVKLMKVRPLRPGRWSVGSNNFSYRDRFGHGQRITGFTTDLVVEPEELDDQRSPSFETSLLTEELPFSEWSELRIRVANTGRVPLPGVAVRVHGQLDVDEAGAWRELGPVEVRGRVDAVFHVRAGQRGSHVPVHVDTRCGPDRVSRQVGIRVAATGGTAGSKVGILYLSANPVDEERIRTDREVREIRAALARGRARDEFTFDDRFAVRTADLSQSLHDCRPTVIHFACHGTPDGSVVLETDGGRSMPTSPESIAEFFSIVSDEVECVIVNACGSAPLAEMVARHVKYAIGMEDVIDDRTAISFSVGFYQALAAQHPVEKAFRFGCAQVNLDNGGTGPDGNLLPRLFVR
ncbi:CHAT domain-containing protein [Lentzea sp. E54]|uniref:CHAT domain-containing protein n=1 Tax=Lentzea xerophila TaxID=3435883 RepID=UPI003DA3993C